jgi:hypothetical protein
VWRNSVKGDCRKIRYENIDWNYLVQNTALLMDVVRKSKNHWVP